VRKGEGYLQPHSIETYKSFAKRVRTELGDWRVDDLIKDVETIEKWVNEFQTLGTPDRVIPDRMAKGNLISGKVIPGRPPRPASKKPKLHLKAFLHLLLESAMKWKIIPMQRNPLSLWPPNYVGGEGRYL
jgi:hypothetical protein